MDEVICINPECSTTRRLVRSRPPAYPDTEGEPKPPVSMTLDPRCKADGGLRTQGYSKWINSSSKGSVSTGRATGQRPLISVITVVFNGAENLEKTILSVLNQTYDNVEYVIVDGGSNDGTCDILRKYEHAIDYWISESDDGVYDAFNKACRLVRGDWINFLGAGDVFYDKSVLELIAQTASSVAENIQIIYGKVCITNDNGVPIEIINMSWDEMRDKWRGGRPMLPHHQGIFHGRSLLSGETPFDTAYKIAADSKLIYKSIKATSPVFVDVMVATAALGGVSTEPKHYISTANEIIKINKELHHTNYGHQSWFYLKSLSKSFIYEIGGAHLAKYCIDIYRVLTGRKTKWNSRSSFEFSVRPETHAARQFKTVAIWIFNCTYNFLPFFACKNMLLRLVGMQIGDGTIIHTPARFLGMGRINLGSDTTIGSGCYLVNRVGIRIGNNVSIAHGAKIYTLGHDIDDPHFAVKGAEVEIGDYVCIFSQALIMPGVKLGKGAVVYPGSVVTKDVGEYEVVGGNPARFIRYRSKDLQYKVNHDYWFSL